LVRDPSRFATIAAKAHETSRQYSIENWTKIIAALLAKQWGCLGAQPEVMRAALASPENTHSRP
jgi:hypothetical protein